MVVSMNRENIIRMAIEAGLHRQQHNLMSNPMQHRFSYDGYEENLEHFAALVASAEREACAKVVDAAKAGEEDWDSNDWNQAVEFCASRIRARGQA
jgi:hypothetical protein